MIGFQLNEQEFKEVKRQFSALSVTIRKKVFVKVLKNNTRALENRMKALAPVSQHGTSGNKNPTRNHPPGYLRASIGTIVSRGTDLPTIWVKPRFKGKWDPWYLHFPMAGTKKMKKEPNPFVDKAWGELGETVRTGLLKDLEQQIQAEINKLK